MRHLDPMSRLTHMGRPAQKYYLNTAGLALMVGGNAVDIPGFATKISTQTRYVALGEVRAQLCVKKRASVLGQHRVTYPSGLQPSTERRNGGVTKKAGQAPNPVRSFWAPAKRRGPAMAK